MTHARFTVTAIVENAPRESFVAEHGLSLWIETPQGAVLFDTGQGKALIPAAAAAIRSLPPRRVCCTSAPVELVPDVGTTGEVPRATPYEDVGGPFFLDPEGKTPDTIPDDQSLWIKTDKGLVVICGCAHSGVVNTVYQARRVTGEHRVAGLIGGFHLNAASETRLQETARVLLDWNVGFIMPCHCSGQCAADYLRGTFGDRVQTFGVGDVLKF